jgi:hypothetical protein
MGCGCLMPLKAMLESNCWLWELTGDGWPDELNSDYERPDRT